MCGMALGPEIPDTGGMSGGLTLRRVQGDVDVLSRSGLDTATFIEEFLASISRAVPHVAACVATLDPATHLLTGTYKFGDLYGNDQHDIEWAQFEYGDPDGTSFIELIDRDVPVSADSLTVDGDPRRVRRSRRLHPTDLRLRGRIEDGRPAGHHRLGGGGVVPQR